MGRMKGLYRKFNEACDKAGVARYHDDSNTGDYAAWKRMAKLMISGNSVLEADCAVDGDRDALEALAVRNDEDYAACNLRALILEHLCRQERKERDAINSDHKAHGWGGEGLT